MASGMKRCGVSRRPAARLAATPRRRSVIRSHRIADCCDDGVAFIEPPI